MKKHVLDVLKLVAFALVVTIADRAWLIYDGKMCNASSAAEQPTPKEK